ncbi:hypothetical protein QYM36_019981 [Artemia franciscana]|uniref:Uncharacterized protein n=1 Tax=Artemia franciscana TaxID=6661 RepID=A0AA88H9I3_ARTSF|nr:hypothetical protein QYM36_019981 [Artemia franciscana]
MPPKTSVMTPAERKQKQWERMRSSKVAALPKWEELVKSTMCLYEEADNTCRKWNVQIECAMYVESRGHAAFQIYVDSQLGSEYDEEVDVIYTQWKKKVNIKTGKR